MFNGVTLAAAVLVLGLVGLTACGGGSPVASTPTAGPTSATTAPPATREAPPPTSGAALLLDVSVRGEDLEFDKEEMSGPAGQEITVRFRNVSKAQQHNWLLVQDGTKDDVAADGVAAGVDNDWVDPNDARVITQTGLLEPATTGEVAFIVPPAGTYQFVCTFPAHNITMFGTFRSTTP